jgi:3-methyladenine DNA glycosylase AlkD
MVDILRKVRAELKGKADEKTRESARRFFKEKIKAYGVKSADVAKIAGAHSKELKDKNKAEVFGLCESLLSSGTIEESFVACYWAYSLRRQYEEGDIRTFEGWIAKYVSNWATCDTLCNHTVGAYVEAYPGQVRRLMGWAHSPNRWMRRAAAVSLIVPAKRGLFLQDAFAISDILIADEDDIVQKGFGWLLKEESRKHQKEVHGYVIKNKARMPRTALRYAIEKMPDGLREEAMGRR